MFGDNKEEKEHRKAIVALLMKMATVDGQVEVIEQQFIGNVARQIGLTEEDINAINANPEQYPVSPPPPEQERMTILYYLLFTMTVDGKVHEAEEKLCYQVGLRLGFNEYMTRDLINVLKKFLNKKLPKEALLNEIKKYMN